MNVVKVIDPPGSHHCAHQRACVTRLASPVFVIGLGGARDAEYFNGRKSETDAPLTDANSLTAIRMCRPGVILGSNGNQNPPNRRATTVRRRVPKLGWAAMLGVSYLRRILVASALRRGEGPRNVQSGLAFARSASA